MNIAISKGAWANGIQQRKVSLISFSQVLKAALICSLGLFFPLQNLLAQATEVTWIAKDGYQIGYQYSSTSETFYADDHISVMLHIDADTPLECIGGYFALEPSADLEPDTAGAFSIPSSSPLGAPSDLFINYSFDSLGQTSRARVWRQDNTPRACLGMVMSLHYVVTGDSIDAEDLFASIDGGITMMDNIDMKRGDDETPVQTAFEEDLLRAYPNPCTDWLELTPGSEARYQVYLRDWQGRLIHQGLLGNGERLSMQDFPPGSYLLEIRTEAGEARQVIKIAKR